MESLRRALRQPEVVAPLWLMVALAVWGLRGIPRLPLSDVLGTTDPYALALASFGLGFVLAFVVPVLLIRLWLRQDLRDYGLGLGDPKKGLVVVGIGLAVALPGMWLGSRDPAMREAYPRFGHPDVVPVGSFVAFSLAYALFFLAQEFSMRGFLLFGLEPRSPAMAVAAAALVQVLWHLDAPLPELASAPVWGVVAAVVNLRLRSIWPLFLVHWLSNVFLDACIVYF